MWDCKETSYCTLLSDFLFNSGHTHCFSQLHCLQMFVQRLCVHDCVWACVKLNCMCTCVVFLDEQKQQSSVYFSFVFIVSLWLCSLFGSYPSYCPAKCDAAFSCASKWYAKGSTPSHTLGLCPAPRQMGPAACWPPRAPCRPCGRRSPSLYVNPSAFCPVPLWIFLICMRGQRQLRAQRCGR